MTAYFIDSSALVKRYMPEVGTRWIRELLAARSGHTVLIAYIALVEMMSAVARHYHDGKIERSVLQAFRRLAEHHAQTQYSVLSLTGNIRSQALDLHEKYRLRTLDSIQLASAIEANGRIAAISQHVIFVASDSRLLSAAISEGLVVDDPMQHP